MKYRDLSALLLLLPGLSALFFLAPAGARAQQFTVLHSFNGTDGCYPGPLVLSGDTLYGATGGGGSKGYGVIYKIGTNGSGFGCVHDFAAESNYDRGSDLVLCGSTLCVPLYRFASFQYTNFDASLFGVNTDGSGAGVFCDMGHNLVVDLAPFNNSLCGITMPWISSASPYWGTGGTLFAVGCDGFNAGVVCQFPDAAYPSGSLLAVPGALYGTLMASDDGIVYRVVSETEYMVLHTFNGADGSSPNGRLVLDGNVLYGTTAQGGAANHGTIFKVNYGGSDFHVLYEFSAYDNHESVNNTDGANPDAGLLLSGGKLYGAASRGGSHAFGTLFSLDTNGSNFTVLHTFSGADGKYPEYLEAPGMNLVMSGQTIFGVTFMGGQASTPDQGTVFALTLPPDLAPLDFHWEGTVLTLTWPSSAGWRLQQNPDLDPANWTDATCQVTIVDGQCQAQIPVADDKGFYRLVWP
jgi:uncharacterized repeat protein (TIGR03803 family)